VQNIIEYYSKKREAVNRYNVGGNSRLEVLDKDDI